MTHDTAPTLPTRHEPGHVNGVRCIWPEPAERAVPAPKVQRDWCANGHPKPQFNKFGVCIACRRVQQAEYRARVKAAKEMLA